MDQSLLTIEWKDDLAFGIRELDDEHLLLIAQINSLTSSIGSGAEAGKLQDMMKAILADSWRHFSHEEAMLTEAEYPCRIGHKLLHEQLTSELEYVMRDCRKSNDTKPWLDYGLLVRQLFLEHIRLETKKYKEFCASQAPLALR
jgi:hemerythrin-like metal-binding protein